jgi:hypothetical protein
MRRPVSGNTTRPLCVYRVSMEARAAGPEGRRRGVAGACVRAACACAAHLGMGLRLLGQQYAATASHPERLVDHSGN